MGLAESVNRGKVTMFDASAMYDKICKTLDDEERIIESSAF